MSNFYWWHPPVLCSEHHVLCWLIRYARKLLLRNGSHSGNPGSLLCTYVYFWDLWSIQPQLWSVSQPRIFLQRAQHYLLFYKSICVASTSSVRLADCWLKRHSPSSLLSLVPRVLLVVAAAPLNVSHWSWCRDLHLRTFSAVCFIWVLASFQLDKLCTWVKHISIRGKKLQLFSK